MTDASILASLRAAAGDGRKVQIVRPLATNRHWNGFVEEVSDHLVLLRTLDDFHVDGFSILRVSDIREVRSGANERFFERVLHAEGHLDNLPAPPHLSLASIASVLTGLQRLDPVVITECEEGGPDGPEFYIGRILAVFADVLELQWVSVDGSVDPEPCVVDIARVSLIRFGERYTRYYRKHARWPR